MSLPPPERPLRVLMVSAELPSETSPNSRAFIRTQMESLQALGIEVLHCAVTGAKGIKYLRAVPRLRRLIRHGRFDLVHAHYGFSGLVARMQSQVPLVISFLGSDLFFEIGRGGRPKLASHAWLRANRLLARSAAAVIVKTPAMAARLRGGNIHVIPNGVDLRLFRPMDRRAAREELGLAPEVKLVLFPADPSRPVKDYRTARRAVDLLNAERGEPRADRGRDENRDKNRDENRDENQIVDSGDDRVELLHLDAVPHARVPLLMNAADVVLMTSFHEGSPNVIKEALACERPILSTDVGDVRDLIEGLPGCGIVPRDPQVIARRLAETLESAPERTGGRARVAHLDLETVARRVARVYEEVLAERGKGPSHPRA